MQPEGHISREEEITRQMNKEKNTVCKNGKFDLIIEVGKETHFKNEGCKNLRRMGSAWCQECSDDFKNKNK